MPLSLIIDFASLQCGDGAICPGFVTQAAFRLLFSRMIPACNIYLHSYANPDFCMGSMDALGNQVLHMQQVWL